MRYKKGEHATPKTEFKKGHLVTQETRKKISLALTGRKLSEEHRMKLGNGWRGKKRPPFSDKWRKNMSKAHKGHKVSEETKKKIRIARLGKRHSIKTRIKISQMKSGAKSNLWKGGISPINKKIRRSTEFRLWREAVFARDNWICQKMGVRGGKLHPHHIKNFAQYPRLRFAINNGITLSEKSHWEFHKKYGQENNTKEQLEEFLNGKARRFLQIV